MKPELNAARRRMHEEYPRGEYLIPISLERVIARLLVRSKFCIAGGGMCPDKNDYRRAADLCAGLWRLDW